MVVAGSMAALLKTGDRGFTTFPSSPGGCALGELATGVLPGESQKQVAPLRGAEGGRGVSLLAECSGLELLESPVSGAVAPSPCPLTVAAAGSLGEVERLAPLLSQELGLWLSHLLPLWALAPWSP